MAAKREAAAPMSGGDGQTKTTGGRFNPTPPADQAARRDALALLTRAYRAARAEADHAAELAIQITGIARALKHGCYDPDFTIERMIDIGALDIIDDNGGRS